MAISYELSAVPELEDRTRQHSYFEDGPDPEELLALPEAIMQVLQQLNDIHHTGMIILKHYPSTSKYIAITACSIPPGKGSFGYCWPASLRRSTKLRGWVYRAT